MVGSLSLEDDYGGVFMIEIELILMRITRVDNASVWFPSTYGSGPFRDQILQMGIVPFSLYCLQSIMFGVPKSCFP